VGGWVGGCVRAHAYLKENAVTCLRADVCVRVCAAYICVLAF
jgi:hypothetical protein